MGVVSNIFRTQMLIARQHDLQAFIGDLTEAKVELANSVTDYIDAGQNLDDDSPTLKRLKARREKLELMEKKIDLRLKEYENKLQMVNTQLQSLEGSTSQMIQSSFQYKL